MDYKKSAQNILDKKSKLLIRLNTIKKKLMDIKKKSAPRISMEDTCFIYS